MVHFFAVLVYEHNKLLSETRYYFGECFLKSKRLEISHIKETNRNDKLNVSGELVRT